MPRLFSSFRASRILGATSRTLRALVKRGFIHAERPSGTGQWKYRAADVFAYKKWGPPLQRTGTAARVIGVHPRTLNLWADRGLVSCVRDSYGDQRNPQRQRIYDRDHVIEIAQLRREHGRRLAKILEERAGFCDQGAEIPTNCRDGL